MSAPIDISKSAIIKLMVLNCTVNSFGCELSSWGAPVADFTNSFGTPFSSFIFILLIAGFIILLFIAARTVLTNH